MSPGTPSSALRAPSPWGEKGKSVRRCAAGKALRSPPVVALAGLSLWERSPQDVGGEGPGRGLG